MEEEAVKPGHKISITPENTLQDRFKQKQLLGLQIVDLKNM